jgi:hypothetical protein
MIRINVSVCDHSAVFPAKSNPRQRYNHFFITDSYSQHVCFERNFLFSRKLRYSISIHGGLVNVVVSRDYFKFIRYRFMNLHSIGHTLTDLTAGLLLDRGLSTIHCSAVKIRDRVILIFAPPNTGKSLTALNLCRQFGSEASFIAEDFALTDGHSVWGFPYTSTFRTPPKSAQLSLATYAGELLRSVPLLRLMFPKKPKGASDYLPHTTLLHRDEVTDIVLLAQGPERAHEDPVKMLQSLINLNKYELNYHRSPALLVMNYFNPGFCLDHMYGVEQSILRQLVTTCRLHKMCADAAPAFAELIADKLLL